MAQRGPGFFDVDERLSALSAKGDDLERVKGLVDFEMFRPALMATQPSGVIGRPIWAALWRKMVLIVFDSHFWDSHHPASLYEPNSSGLAIQ